MALWERSFVEFLIEKIKIEGLLCKTYSIEEIQEDVIEMIWKAYDEFK